MLGFTQGTCDCCRVASVLVKIGALKMNVFVQKVHYAAFDMSFYTDQSKNPHLIICHATYDMTEIGYLMVYDM